MQLSSGPTSRQPLFWAGAALLAFVIGVVFQGVGAGDFLTWDDDINITRNPHLQGATLSAENLRWMFTDAAYMRRYVPLAWLGWGVEKSLTGLTARSAHLGNLLLHGLNALLVLAIVDQVLKRMLADASLPRRYFVAGGIALLWAIHPMRVEVVAWASGRLYLQAVAFALVSMLAYFEATARASGSAPRRGWLTFSVLAYLGSLLSYPVALPFPVLLLAVDFALIGRFRHGWRVWRDPESRTAMLEKIPFAAVAVAVLMVTWVARVRAQGLWAPLPTLAEFGVLERIAQACYVWMYYLWRPLWPAGFAPVYTALLEFDPWQWPFVLSALGLVALTMLLGWKRAVWPGLLVAWACYLALMVPMLGLAEHPHYTNDRYNYLSSILIFAVMAVGLGRLRTPAWRVAGGGALALACAACAMLSARQVGVWRDSETLFRFLRGRLDVPSARADIDLRLGDVLRTKGRFGEALPLYEESLRISPAGARSALAYWGVGLIKREAGQAEDALRFFQEAARQSPGLAQAHFSLGELRNAVGQYSAAIDDFRRGLALDPGSAVASHGLLVAFLQAGRAAEAAEEGMRATRLDPRSVAVRLNWAVALHAAGRTADAVTQCREAVRLEPQRVDAWIGLGEYLRSGALAESAAAFQEALRLNPSSALAHNGLGVDLAMAGQIPQAVQEFQAATQADPNFAQAHLNLGIGLRDLQRRDEAKTAFTRALQLNPNFEQARAALRELQGN